MDCVYSLANYRNRIHCVSNRFNAVSVTGDDTYICLLSFTGCLVTYRRKRFRLTIMPK